MQLTLLADSEINEHGSVVLLKGTLDDGRYQWFAADARMAYDLIGYAQDKGEIQVEVERWQLWGGPR